MHDDGLNGEAVANDKTFTLRRYLRPSSDSISGIAFLDLSSPDVPNLVTLRIRLRASQLKGAVLRLNRECMQEGHGCSTR